MSLKCPKIYSASKIWHAEKWLQARDKMGYNITSSWIDVPCGTAENPTGAKLLSSAEKTQLWVDCAREVTEADMLIVYAEKGDKQRGALVEIGGALSAGTPVYLIGNCKSFEVNAFSDAAYCHHPLFMKLPTQDWKKGYLMAVTAYRECEREILQEKATTYYTYSVELANRYEEQFGEELENA
jgi:hypothetical protein